MTKRPSGVEPSWSTTLLRGGSGGGGVIVVRSGSPVVEGPEGGRCPAHQRGPPARSRSGEAARATKGADDHDRRRRAAGTPRVRGRPGSKGRGSLGQVKNAAARRVGRGSRAAVASRERHLPIARVLPSAPWLRLAADDRNPVVENHFGDCPSGSAAGVLAVRDDINFRRSKRRFQRSAGLLRSKNGEGQGTVPARMLLRPSSVPGRGENAALSANGWVPRDPAGSCAFGGGRIESSAVSCPISRHAQPTGCGGKPGATMGPPPIVAQAGRQSAGSSARHDRG